MIYKEAEVFRQAPILLTEKTRIVFDTVISDTSKFIAPTMDRLNVPGDVTAAKFDAGIRPLINNDYEFEITLLKMLDAENGVPIFQKVINVGDMRNSATIVIPTAPGSVGALELEPLGPSHNPWFDPFGASTEPPLIKPWFRCHTVKLA